MNIKEQIRAEIDARRQNMVYELYGLLDDSEKYIRVKGMHDAYVDMLTYIDHLPEQPVDGLEETADLLAIAHLQGMEQQKSKMLEEAVEGTVCKDESDVWIEIRTDALPNFKDMQPVKLIVKEDVE